MTAGALQTSGHVSLGIDLWEREDVWSWSWSDPWKYPNALQGVEGNLSAERTEALPGEQAKKEPQELQPDFLKGFHAARSFLKEKEVALEN